MPVDDSRDFVINFTPTALGTAQTRITIRSNDPDDEDPYTFDLNGTGQGPEIAVDGFGTSGGLKAIPDGNTALSISDGTEFGNVNVTGAKTTHNFIVYNHGTKNLRISGAGFTGSGASHFSVEELFAGNPFADIAPEKSRTFTITFNPSSAGSKLATFTMDNNDLDEDPYTFRVRGFGVAKPDIRVRGLTSTNIPYDIADGDTNPDQDVTQYGNVNPGAIATRVYRIVNDGDATLNITSIQSSSPSYTIPGPPTSVPAGDSVDFVIDFQPTAIGEDETIMTIASNDPDAESTYTFALTGVGKGPEIMVQSLNSSDHPEITNGQTPPAYESGTYFGRVNLGQHPIRSRLYRVTNIGNQNLRIRSREFTGSGKAHFDVSGLLAGNPFADLSPLESRDFTIEFDPESVGSKLATFSMETNDGDEDPFTFQIQGIAVSEPTIDVRGRSGGLFTNWHLVHHGDTSPSSENGTQFGAMAITGDPITKTFELTNSGTAPMTITSIDCDLRDFRIERAPRLIAAGSSQTFDIVFDPTSTGFLRGTISISSDASDYPEFTFTVEGYSWDNVSARVQVDGRPFTRYLGDGNLIGELFDIWRPISHNDPDVKKSNGTDFKTVNLDDYESEPASFRVTNAGASPLTLLSTVVDSPQFQVFSSADESPHTIMPGDSTWIMAIFHPWSYGRHDAQITIETDAPDGNPFIIRVSGFADTSDGPEIRINEPDDAYRALPGETITEVINVYNVGNKILTLGNWDLNGSSRFTLESAPKVLAPGAGGKIVITFTAPSSGTALDEATISVATNDPDDGEFAVSFPIIGEAGVPQLVVKRMGGWDDDIANGSTTIIEDEENGTGFGTNSPDGPPIARSFRLLNETALGTLHLDNIDISSASFRVEGAPSEIEAGEEGTLTISYLPVGGGTELATVSIFSDDPDDNPYRFAIQGTSTGETPPPDIVDFRQIGESSDASLTFQSYPGKRYRIRWSLHPTTGWSTVGSLSGIDGDGYWINRTLPGAFLPDRLFFQVEEH